MYLGTLMANYTGQFRGSTCLGIKWFSKKYALYTSLYQGWINSWCSCFMSVLAFSQCWPLGEVGNQTQTQQAIPPAGGLSANNYITHRKIQSRGVASRTRRIYQNYYYVKL